MSEQRYKPYGEVRWASGAGMPTDFTFTGQRAGPANFVGSLMDYVARGYSPALGRFVSADTIVPGAGSSQTLNRYMYVFGNPLEMVDPTGHDPWYREKYDMVRSLNAYATDLKKGVASGNVKPVQAIVELSARTWEATDHNTDNYVWAMTVLLIGADTDQVSLVDYFQGSAQIAHSWSTLETSTVGQDWLPFAAGGPAHNSDQGVQRGDWNAAYWDQTSNQAFHFWTYVSLTYYEGDLVAWAANFFHDPPFGTRDQWREARQGGAGVFSSWARAFIDGGVEVSREDYDLGLAGMRFANAISHYEYVSGQGGQAWRVSKPAADPNEWLRRHLME